MIQREIEDLDPNKEMKFHSVEFVCNYPVLRCILDGTYDPQGCLEILLAAKKYGINVHSGGITDFQYSQATNFCDSKDPDYKDKILFFAAKIVNENSCAARKKVLYYGGAHHNNTDGEGLELSFGDDLIAEYGKKAYLDIDLLVPGVILDLEIFSS